MRGTTESILAARGRPGRATRGAVFALALVVVTSFATAAGATTPESTYATATAQAAALNARIAANSKRADILDERYLRARHAVTVARSRIAALQTQIGAIEAHVHLVRARLGDRAALLYMGAGSGDPIGMDAVSVQDLGSMAQYGDAAAAQDQRLLDDLQNSNDRLAAHRDRLEEELAAARTRAADAASARREIVKLDAATMKLLDSTNASVKLLATQIEQKAEAAAAIAERAWLKQFAAEQAARLHGAPGIGVPQPDPTVPADPGVPPGDLKPPVPGALLAVAYARAQLGKPYVYAAAGPAAFDCSGLTMMAWAQSGVSMEHGSQAQWEAFPKVPIDELQPGDLVFFGVSGPQNHHVGIVVGPGLMIDAPHTGAYVELVSYFQPDLVLTGSRP